MITKAGEDMVKEKYVHTVRVGEMYQSCEERRETVVRVEDTDVKIRENLWKDTDDQFETEHKWSVTAHLRVSQECGTKDECMTSAQDSVRILKALGFLGYELHSMEGDGVSIWDRPAPDREECES